MKTTTTKSATKKVAKKKKVSTTTRTVTVSIPEVKQKYTTTMTMGSVEAIAHGSDEKMFSELMMPKVTGKCLLKVTNNENGKSFETHFAPFMAKKILTNIFVQKFQWKRVAGKIA